MPAERLQKNSARQNETSRNENSDQRSKKQLFTETDAKSVEVSGYTSGYVLPNQPILQRAMPTGVVEIDKSVQFPVSSTQIQSSDHSKPNTAGRSSENRQKDDIHLPSIKNHSHNHRNSSSHFHNHHPYGYLQTQSNYNPVDYPYRTPGHNHHHHSNHSHKHHHRHHHHHHHEYQQELETYDPRWWYLPVNTVHAPKPWQPSEYHYVAPKWYELNSKSMRMSTNIPELRPSPRKYADCRCEVCKPSKTSPRGVKWIVNE